MSIGPAGDPVTSYSHDDGVVSLSERDAVVFTTEELRSAVRSIRNFRAAVISTDKPAIVAPSVPLIYRVLVDDPGIATARFRCNGANGSANLTLDATVDLTTGESAFETRPAREITWGDFDLFLRWLTLLSDLVAR